jgi:hypothetical protein
MLRKFLPVLSIIIISVLGIFFFFDSGSENKAILKSTFEIDATYYESGYVEISYLDKSNNTDTVTMEILGMDKSFQKKFSGSKFVERVEFTAVPKYGWQIHPVTFLIQHNELGQVSLKTEIHTYGQVKPEIIYGSP